MSAPGLLLLSRSGCHLCEQLVVDLSNYKDRVGSRVPAGRYRVQVEVNGQQINWTFGVEHLSNRSPLASQRV